MYTDKFIYGRFNAPTSKGSSRYPARVCSEPQSWLAPYHSQNQQTCVFRRIRISFVRYSYHCYTYLGDSGIKYRDILTSLSSIDLAAACLACFLELPEPVAVMSGIITWNKFFILRWKIWAFDLLQWGSESRPFENWKHSKTGLFEGWHSRGGTIRKTDNWFVV